jgi:hypothetical protein
LSTGKTLGGHKTMAYEDEDGAVPINISKAMLSPIPGL